MTVSSTPLGIAKPLEVEAINALLPQWQCRRCEYDTCYDYAVAITRGEAINRCPPGGDAVLSALSALAKTTPTTTNAPPPIPNNINPTLKPVSPLTTAAIRANACIGCTRCIRACPLSAIIGGKRGLHAVITESCSGCEACLPVCPMDCIDMLPSREWQGASLSDNTLMYHDSRQTLWLNMASTTRQRQEVGQHNKSGRTRTINTPIENTVASIHVAPSTINPDWVARQVAKATELASAKLHYPRK